MGIVSNIAANIRPEPAVSAGSGLFPVQKNTGRSGCRCGNGKASGIYAAAEDRKNNVIPLTGWKLNQ